MARDPLQLLPELPSSLHVSVRRWILLWEVPDLLQDAHISFSSRFRRGLGRCYPQRGVITLASDLRTAPLPLLEEILCHELAHLAAYKLYGEHCRPHGSEWAELMRMVGFEPRVCLPAQAIERPPSLRRRRYVYLHRCPVCRAERRAGRVVRAWRCAACIASGLEGSLEVFRISAKPK